MKEGKWKNAPKKVNLKEFEIEEKFLRKKKLKEHCKGRHLKNT